jgi:hypothetical protein
LLVWALLLSSPQTVLHRGFTPFATAFRTMP